MKKQKCEFDQKDMILISGETESFFCCKNYPNCKNKKSFNDVVKYINNIEGIKIFQAKNQCWKCSYNSNIYAYDLSYQINELYPNITRDSLLESSLQLNGPGWGVDENNLIIKAMQREFKNIKLKYSWTANSEYIANCCEKCDSLFGNWYLFMEPDGAFFDIENTNFKLIKFNL